MIRRRHVFAFLVTSIGVGLVVLLGTISSAPYQEAERFVRQDPFISYRVGTVKSAKFAFWREFRFASSEGNGNAKFSFDTVAERGAFVVDVRLKARDHAWTVYEFSVRPRGGS